MREKLQLLPFASNYSWRGKAFKRALMIYKVVLCCKLLKITLNDFFGWYEADAAPMPYMAAEGVSYGGVQRQRSEVGHLLAQIAELKADKAFLQAQVSALMGAVAEKKSVWNM